MRVLMANQARIGAVPEATASSVLAWPAIGITAARGASTGKLARKAGIDLTDLADSTARVSLRSVQKLWAIATEQLGEPHLGLAALQELGASRPHSWPDPVSLYENVFSACATLGEGVDTASRYVRILRDGFDAYIHDRDGRSSLRFDFDDGDPPAFIQLHVGMVALIKRRVLPGVEPISEVWLTESTPSDPGPYQRFFGVPVRFEAPYDGLISARPRWHDPLPTADAARRKRECWRADALLAKLPDLHTVSDRVRLAVRAGLPSSDLRVDAVAKQLALSPRTLHRRLAAEGQSFQRLLDEARRQLAMRELASGNLPVRDVGLRVGFRNVSAFHRAFKAWTGMTPSEFREQHSPRADGGTP